MPKPEIKLYVRATDAEKAAFTRAAAHEGMKLSVWVRLVLRTAAEATLKREGEKPAYKQDKF